LNVDSIMSEINLINTYSFAVVSCSFFCSIYLLWKGKTRPLNQRLVGLLLLCINLFGLTSLATLSGYLILFPWLFRIFYPLYFLIPPFLFFYVRQGFGGPGVYFKKDWLHFVPALTVFIGLIPLYIAPLSQKMEWAELIYLNPDYTFYLKSGWIPGTYLHLGKDLQTLIYGLACIYLWRKNASLMASELFISIRKHVIHLSLFFLVYALISISLDLRFLILGDIQPFLRESEWALFFEFLIFTLLLAFNLYFFFGNGPHVINPENTIKNLPAAPPRQVTNSLTADTVDSKVTQSPVEQKVAVAIKLDLTEKEKQILDRLYYGMETSEWYRDRGFSASKCSEHLGIEKHVLGALFKKAILFRFNDFVNHYRVLYVKKAIKNGDLKKYTLEHIATEAGFNSRTTFYNAFVKKEGVNPTQYILQSAD